MIIGGGFNQWNLCRESTVARQLAMDKVQAIKDLHQAGYSERKIAEQLHISRKAVRHHLGRNGSKGTRALTGEALTGSGAPMDTKALTGSEDDSAGVPSVAVRALESDQAAETVAPQASPRALSQPESASHCAPFHELILLKLEQGLTAQRVYQDLCDEHGFPAKYHSVRRYIAKLGKSTDVPFRRMEVGPGEQLQVDFGLGAPCLDHSGKLRRTYVFRAVLGYSRKAASEAVKRMTVEMFLIVLENTFWRLGGVPKVVLFDNGSCAVKQADWYDSELHPKIIDFCKHYGFVLTTTKPRMPRHKGKVERGVGYVKSNALKGRKFASLAEQNQFLDHWESTVADTRIHGTTKRHVRDQFIQVEKPALRPLPADRFPFYEEGRRKVSRDGHIQIQRAFYSVPPEYLGRIVWVRWNSRIVRILNDRMEQIAIHSARERGFSTHTEHIAPEKIRSIEKGIEFFLRKVHFIGPSAVRWAELLVEERGVEASRSLQGLLSLTKKYSSGEINHACSVAWRSRATNYRTIKRLLEQRSGHTPQQTLEFLDEHPMIRPVAVYGEFVSRAIQSSHQNSVKHVMSVHGSIQGRCMQ